MGIRIIVTEAELDALLEASRNAPVLLFKHSNTCSVSSRAHDQVDRLLAASPQDRFEAAMIVVQTARRLSDLVEERLGIRHESPQVIVLRDAAPVWHASHWDVTEAKLADALDRV